jgi:predicted transcriptional regulator
MVGLLNNLSMNEDDWFDDEEEQRDNEHMSQQLEMQKLLKQLELKSKNMFRYLVTEGFIEKTDRPDEYKYTPEGFVLAQQQYKKMREEGLL